VVEIDAPNRSADVSMRRLPADLLERPAPEGVRRLALARLHDFVVERKRLDDPDDADAIHDFRVALRRLRSVLRAYRGVLDDSVSSKNRRGLSRIATLSGVYRDAEVRLQWIAERRHTIRSAGNPGLPWVAQQLRRERRAGKRNLARELELHFAATSATLERRLMHYRVTLGPDETPVLPVTRELMSSTLLGLIGTLRDRLASPKRVGDVRALHMARIASKRLRYALEPLAEGGFASPRLARSAVTAVAELGSLQDELGRINDAHSFRRWLRKGAAERSPRLANLNLLTRGMQRLLRLEAETSYEVVTAPANRKRVERTLRAIELSARAMAPRRSSPDILRADESSRPE
jgi:CHAD domain-containing protein